MRKWTVTRTWYGVEAETATSAIEAARPGENDTTSAEAQRAHLCLDAGHDWDDEKAITTFCRRCNLVRDRGPNGTRYTMFEVNLP